MQLLCDKDTIVRYRHMVSEFTAKMLNKSKQIKKNHLLIYRRSFHIFQWNG